MGDGRTSNGQIRHGASHWIDTGTTNGTGIASLAGGEDYRVAIARGEAEAGGAGDGIARSGGAAVGAEGGSGVVATAERIGDGRTADRYAGDIAGDRVGDSGAADCTGVASLAGGDGDIGVAVSVIESDAGGR